MFSYYDPFLTTINHHESPVVSVVAMAMSRSRPFPARSTNWWLRRSCLTANFFAAELQLLTPHHWPSPVEKMNQLGSSSHFIICYPFCGTDSFCWNRKKSWMWKQLPGILWWMRLQLTNMERWIETRLAGKSPTRMDVYSWENHQGIHVTWVVFMLANKPYMDHWGIDGHSIMFIWGFPWGYPECHPPF